MGEESVDVDKLWSGSESAGASCDITEQQLSDVVVHRCGTGTYTGTELEIQQHQQQQQPNSIQEQQQPSSISASSSSSSSSFPATGVVTASILSNASYTKDT